MSNRATLEEEIAQADLVIGTVLVPGARAPRLITARMVAKMKPGAAFVDLSIDQGGISETSHPTTHAHPIYIQNGVVHYCVTNMPGVVPHTSTYALTNATLSYALDIADHGLLEAGRARSWRFATASIPTMAKSYIRGGGIAANEAHLAVELAALQCRSVGRGSSEVLIVRRRYDPKSRISHSDPSRQTTAE